MTDASPPHPAQAPIDDVEKRWRSRLAAALAIAGVGVLVGATGAVVWLVTG